MKILDVIDHNKTKYTEYNAFRKQIFRELAPVESEDLLYMLPWLLCVNHPKCPGYTKEKKFPFRITQIMQNVDIKEREWKFKKRFGIRGNDSLLNFDKDTTYIEGIYTIGSIGSVNQTSSSDCDIWVCYDKKKFTKKNWNYLNFKINLIKDWMDENLKIPVFFFLSDITDIKEGRFGNIDEESSGSLQKNVLKEEFYRTCIVIEGKIPFWWVCCSGKEEMDYEKTFLEVSKDKVLKSHFVDLGTINEIETYEYFSAALWQLHKSLTRPLKSIIKMILLEIMLTTPDNLILCNQFRQIVLANKKGDPQIDPGVFSMSVILKFYKDKKSESLFELIKECLYLRCDISPINKKKTLKGKLTQTLFHEYTINTNTKKRLGNFKSWDFFSQVKLGTRIFKLLFLIYKNNTIVYKKKSGSINQSDLKILGRKIAASYQEKSHKISVIHKPERSLNVERLQFVLKDKLWKLYVKSHGMKLLGKDTNIVPLIAHLTWNNLFVSGVIKMEPNPSSMRIQEIINLAVKIKSFIGTYDEFDTDLNQYLAPERMSKMLVVISFENSPWEKSLNDFSVVHQNNWGELFVEQFDSIHRLNSFLRKCRLSENSIDVNYYLQKNCTYYEKIISRIKNTIYQNQTKFDDFFV